MPKGGCFIGVFPMHDSEYQRFISPSVPPRLPLRQACRRGRISAGPALLCRFADQSSAYGRPDALPVRPGKGWRAVKGRDPQVTLDTARRRYEVVAPLCDPCRLISGGAEGHDADRRPVCQAAAGSLHQLRTRGILRLGEGTAQFRHQRGSLRAAARASGQKHDSGRTNPQTETQYRQISSLMPIPLAALLSRAS